MQDRAYFVVTGTRKPAGELAFRALVDDVAHFLWVGVEGQRRASNRGCDGYFKRVPRSASVFRTIVRSPTSEDECLDTSRGIRQPAGM